MIKSSLFLCFFLLLFSCAKNNFTHFNSFEIIEIYNDTISIRGITIKNNTLWFAGNNGKFGTIDLETNKIIKNQIKKDTFLPEFRSIATTSNAAFVLSVANPGLLYRISNDTKIVKLVYQETNDKVFYDSMQFLDDSFGVAMGDPVANCLNVIITTDGGENWTKIPCDKLPKVVEGEAAFAASNTNLILKGNAIFMVSGGKKSRCFVSTDKGNTWNVYDTPIVQGEAMTGIFTADFYNEKIGFVAGGNYEEQNNTSNNKAITTNGGKTWELVANGEGFGYASCVQFIPNSDGKGLLSVGGTGVFISHNSGKNWEKIDDSKDLYTIRFQNDSVAFAAGRNKIVQLKLKK